MSRTDTDQFHRYAVGQLVNIISISVNGGSLTGKALPSHRFKILRLLPETQGVCQYRIQSTRDHHQRVVTESEISKA